MSSPSKTYRVYCYDAALIVVSVDEIQAPGDEQAIAAAEQMGFGDKCEIWHGRRLVTQLNAERRQA